MDLGLGFGLNQIVCKSIHFVFALALPLALLLLMSCKQAHEFHAPLGPEVSSSDLDAVLGKAIEGASVEKLQKGQMLHYEESVRINNSDPNLLESTNDLTVIDRYDDVDTQTTRITTHRSQNMRTVDGDGWRNVESEDTLEIPTAPVISASLLMSVGTRADDSDSPTPPKRITYHNMRVSEGDIDPPDKVKSRPNCSNLHNCRVHVTYLSYDEVRWQDDTHYDKRSYDFELTSDLPFMNQGLYGIMTSGCVGFFQNINGKNYYLRDCQYVSDLQM